MKKSHYKEKIGLWIIQLVDLGLAMSLFLLNWSICNGYFFRTDYIDKVNFSLRQVIAAVFMLIVWNRVFRYMGMYQFRRIPPWPRRMGQTIFAYSLGTAIWLFIAGMARIKGVSGTFPMVLWSSMGIFLIYRSLIFAVLYFLRVNHRNIHDAIIVGFNKRSVALAEELVKPRLGYKVAGFIDDMHKDGAVPEIPHAPVLCPLSGLEQYISVNPVDEVFLALPIRTYYDEINRIIDICATQGIKTRMVMDLFDLPDSMRRHFNKDLLGSFISYDVNPRSDVQEDLKRMVDIIFSLAGLIILFPVFLIISLAIMADDGQPVLFTQKRVGRGKKLFKMHKFRTMIPGADKMQAELENLNEADGAVFKIDDDPRLTRIGGFLRRTSLDELPQLANVLAGSMSLVGPRPLPLRDFKRFYKDSHRRRFSVKPGITGLWQVSGRSDISFEEWMKMDLEYVDNWSQKLDFEILAKTLIAVVSEKGAK